MPSIDYATRERSVAHVERSDVCVLPAPGETVWWRVRHRFDMRFRGHHGGLSEDEARTQVAALVV